MSDHEFYADPTVFDHWQNNAGKWLGARCEILAPYRWTITFASASLVLLSIFVVSLGVFVHGSGSHTLPAWNQSLAQGICAVVALLAAQTLFQQALNAWPEGIRVPRSMRRLGRSVGWRPAKVPARKKARRPSRKARPRVEQEDVQLFFAGVRAAGVNVAIARALFRAGIRSPRQLLKASDSRLVAIRGVGPATVHKLRVQFGKQVRR